MKFVSTRKMAPAASLSEAVRQGAAPDGGLYLPETIPVSAGIDPGLPLAQFAAALLRPFFEGDALAAELDRICLEAFDFPLDIVAPDHSRPGLRALELFHGPTGAFKDFGARFLLACFDRLGGGEKPLTVLAATSGDTGGAVGCAAQGRHSVRAVILYPRGRVSPFQELQLTCWGDNVQALEVDGDFDDCQRLVKAAFADPDLVSRHSITSANSINIGRLLPQVAYAGWAAAQIHSQTGEKSGFLVPTGNLGHCFAVLYARAMGLPVGPVRIVTNANRTLSDWHRTGRYEPRASVSTLANAMDVGAPSNFERLSALPQLGAVAVDRVDDEAIRDRIGAEFRSYGYIWCPHSATAVEAYARLSETERNARPWIVAATAHPFKFASAIEPVIGAPIAASPALAAIGQRCSRKRAIAPNLEALAQALED